MDPLRWGHNIIDLSTKDTFKVPNDWFPYSFNTFWHSERQITSLQRKQQHNLHCFQCVLVWRFYYLKLGWFSPAVVTTTMDLLCAKVDSFALSDSFGQGSGTILLDDVSCSSTSYLHLLSCRYSTVISSSCDHSDDVAVLCCEFIASCKLLECVSFSSEWWEQRRIQNMVRKTYRV